MSKTKKAVGEIWYLKGEDVLVRIVEICVIGAWSKKHHGKPYYVVENTAEGIEDHLASEDELA